MSKFLSTQKDFTCVHVNQILSKWHTTDAEICRYADENSLVVVTKDHDFKNSHFIHKTPKKVIRVALGNMANKDLLKIFDSYLQFILPLNNRTQIYIEISDGEVTIIE